MKHWMFAAAIAGSVFGTSAQNMAVDLIAPNSNLKTDRTPIPKAIADKVAMYTDFRGYGFVDWHPKEQSMILRHREAGADTAQLYLLPAPGAKIKN